MSTLSNCKFRVIRIEPWPWVGRNKATELLALFKESNLALTKFGTSESRTFPLENRLEDFLDLWMEKRYVILKSKEPWRLLVSVMMYPAGASHIGVFIDTEYFRDTSRANEFIELAKSIYSWGAVDHGFIALEEEYEKKNAYYAGKNKVYGGANPALSLPGIYWMNLFGPRYVEWMGINRFKTLPAYEKEELSDGGWMILTRTSLTSYDDKVSGEMERKVRKHLGVQAFFDNKNPQRKTVVPPFASTGKS